MLSFVNLKITLKVLDFIKLPLFRYKHRFSHNKNMCFTSIWMIFNQFWVITYLMYRNFYHFLYLVEHIGSINSGK